uniref:Reverse transcriptase domain-containing protein n=1 Tax=Cannabis sativa TaxID=3483 RepID=A0A803P0Y7_CANSA
MKEQYATLNIDDEDNEGLLFEAGVDELQEIDGRWLLVGRFLTNKSIDFQAMQNKMATLWQPGRGLYVKELDPNLFLFQFYHEVDIERVIEGSPWTFDRVPLIFERVKPGVNPRWLQFGMGTKQGSSSTSAIGPTVSSVLLGTFGGGKQAEIIQGSPSMRLQHVGVDHPSISNNGKSHEMREPNMEEFNVNIVEGDSNEALGQAGGLALLWKEKKEATLLGFSNNHIDAVVFSPNNREWRLTSLYGEPDRSRRQHTWNLLRTLSNHSSLPWCVIGDMNNTVRHEDKRGEDGTLNGLLTGRGTNAWVEVRLDRALVSQSRSLAFPEASLTNLEYSTSDHSPLFLEPKVSDRMTDLRPIALCSVMYKIISKVMVNRMKPFMDTIVSANQSAFIPGRLISDNILVSFEILHYLKRKRKGKDGYMALKLDMSNAILEAQLLVKQGSRWVISDGKSKSILGEPWLPDEENPSIISNHPSLYNAKSIPFQSWPGEDVLTWLKDSSGIYTVRSAYKLLQQLSGDFNLDVLAEDKFWKKLWQLKTPPKMKNLVWRAAKGCLPTMSQLLSKKTNLACLWRPIRHFGMLGMTRDGAEQWNVPMDNSIKVNVDATVFSDSSTYGVGFVARDYGGILVEGSTKLFHGSTTPEVAEAIGVREALSWIKDHL